MEGRAQFLGRMVAQWFLLAQSRLVRHVSLQRNTSILFQQLILRNALINTEQDYDAILISIKIFKNSSFPLVFLYTPSNSEVTSLKALFDDPDVSTYKLNK